VPSIFSSVFEPLASIVDTALVGRLDTNSLAALALSVAIFNAITWMFNFLVHTSTQSVADYEASKNPELLRGRIRIALSLAFSIGLICSVLLWVPKSFWFELAGGEAFLFDEFNSYFSPRVIGHTFTLLSVTLLSLLRGFGRLNLVLGMMILSTTLNIFLSWLFLYPMNLGIAGAAYGTIISHVITTLIGFFFLIKDERVGFKIFKAKVPQGQWLKFGKNSFDLFGRSFTLTLCFFSATRLASRLGVEALGAHQVLLQVWLLASFFLDGLAISGNILGARFYFAGQFKRCAIVFNQLLKLGGIVGFCFTFFYLMGWEFLTKAFTEDPQVLLEMEKVKGLIIVSQMISAIAFVYDGLLFGMSGFGFLRKHMIIGALVVFLPLGLVSLWIPKLWWIWAALVTLNLYRGMSGFTFVKRELYAKANT